MVRAGFFAQNFDEGLFADAGVPIDEAAGLGDLLAEVLDGHNSPTADGIQRAIGRPARDFADYARCAAAAGAWSPAVAR